MSVWVPRGFSGHRGQKGHQIVWGFQENQEWPVAEMRTVGRASHHTGNRA